MRVLQIGADRSQRGILFPGSPAFLRQQGYAKRFGHLDIVGFSLKSDGATPVSSELLNVLPTNSSSKVMMLWDALRMAWTMPRPDVVSAQDPFEAGCIAWFIALRFGVPLHIQVHTDFLVPEYARLPLDHVRRFFARFIIGRAARVRVVSEHIRSSLEYTFRSRKPIQVLPIFTDVERIRRAVPDAALESRFQKFARKVLVVSRLEEEKRVELAVRSFAAAAPLDTCLIIVGDGSEREKLEALARTLSPERRIFFEGEQDAVPYYKLADLVLVTSHYEGYGLVIVEALAAGKPVLSTDVGVAREAGAIVAPPDAFEAALKLWFTDGPRIGELKRYPYSSFDEYADLYCGDILRCVQGK